MALQQLPLGINLPLFKRFDSFIVADNGFLLDLLQAMSDQQGEQQCLIWGAAGVGKTHLLQAVCALAHQHGHTVSYVPLAQFSDSKPDVVQGLENQDVVCIDDCDWVYQKEHWETALFNLINASRSGQTRLIFASAMNPVHADMLLPDLQSRLQWGPVIHLQDLDDERKRQFLQSGAASKGLQMDDKTANYILQHYHRDMTSLAKLLEQLDTESLAAARGLSIPFVKNIIQSN